MMRRLLLLCWMLDILCSCVSVLRDAPRETVKRQKHTVLYLRVV